MRKRHRFTPEFEAQVVLDLLSGLASPAEACRYAATAYVEELIGVGASISMAAVGEPRENGDAERLMRTIKEEKVDLTEYEDFGDALRPIGRFLDELYHRKRIHSSLGYLTPSNSGSSHNNRNDQPFLSRPQRSGPISGAHFKVDRARDIRVS